MVKPGYQTTEFWITLASTVLTVFVVSGVVAPGDKDTLNGAIVNMVTSVGVCVKSAIVIGNYVKSRAVVKTGA